MASGVVLLGGGYLGAAVLGSATVGWLTLLRSGRPPDGRLLLLGIPLAGPFVALLAGYGNGDAFNPVFSSAVADRNVFLALGAAQVVGTGLLLGGLALIQPAPDSPSWGLSLGAPGSDVGLTLRLELPAGL